MVPEVHVHPDVLAFAQRVGLSQPNVAELDELVRSLVALSLPLQTSNPVGLKPSYEVDLEGDLGMELAPSALVGGRYAPVGTIGRGGMGEVTRVRDVSLNRTLAMKTLAKQWAAHPMVRARFIEEAQATSQLQHPNIVPVHDIGEHEDGRLWFTMKEIRGQTLREVARELHDASRERWQPTASGWTFRRVIGAFLDVCRGVAYAHERGVVHRDLKPDNVVIGRNGEVCVVDWGLAKILGRTDYAADAGDLDSVQTERSKSLEHRTQLGTVTGTPAYMPPEQARGAVDRIDTRSDVYALGAMLYFLLSGRPPYEGSVQSVLQQVLAGPPPPVGRHAARVVVGDDLSVQAAVEPSGPPLPAELVSACHRAMAREPSERFDTAAGLLRELEAWETGARRQEQARAMVDEALQGVAKCEALQRDAASLRKESEVLLASVEPWQPEEIKAPAWEKARRADETERAALLADLEVDQGLHAALQVAPDLPEAHAALATRYQARHANAEKRHDADGVARAEQRIRSHLMGLPESHEVHKRCASYLKGDGALTLLTSPPGARVELHRYVTQNRRLVPRFERSLGVTPLIETPLAMGSYLCVISRDGHADVSYPVFVPRRGHWDGVAPGESEAHSVWLPKAGQLPESAVYVPAGWFRSGGDAEPQNAHPARDLWCHAFMVMRFPVTNRDYLAFLNALMAAEREKDAERFAPRERAGGHRESGEIIYGRGDDGTFFLRREEHGKAWEADFPVMHVDWFSARAYLQWRAERTGLPWRLPGELEWEKAARGVDGRPYPWGAYADPTWCRMQSAWQGQHPHDFGVASVHSHPVDVSPYGVRGMGGNVCDWCLEPEGQIDGDRVAVPNVDKLPEDSARLVRGGAWDFDDRIARIGNRYAHVPARRASFLGFRGIFRPERETGA